MRDHLLGRSPRFTGYFCGLAAGLALLAVGLEAARLRFVDSPSTVLLAGYAAFGVLAGLVAAFVAGYLNGGITASWVGGAVPALGRHGAVFLEGTIESTIASAAGAAGFALLVGAAGFVVATEKHRRDSRSADLPPPPPRLPVAVLVVASGAVGGVLLGIWALL
ncbi:hypothetical protein BRD07_02345 [Halobacteriales archaeon QS_9_68_42]|nr:MAG: hypothetical protein BRD07_02345 [Halobacteriales archaeon QS_9_68_42]